MIRFLQKVIKFFSGSFYRELLITFTLILSFVVLVFGGFSVNALVRSNRRIHEENLSSTFERLMDDLDFKMREIEGLTDQVIIHQPSQEIINNPLNTPATVVALKKQVFPHLANLIVSSPIPTTLSLIINSNLLPERILGNRFNESFLGKFAVFSLREENREDARRFGSSQIAWYCDPVDFEAGTIAYGRRVLDSQTLKPMGFVMGRIRISDFFREFSRLEHTETFVFSQEGLLLFSSKESENFDPDRFGILNSSEIPGTSWSILMGVPHEVIREGTFSIFRFSLAVGLLVLLFAVLFSFIFSRFFSRRVESLLIAMKSFRKGDFSVRVDDLRDDEIAGLSQAFNSVVTDMEKLVRQVKDSEREKKRVELNLLKAQINPHFLYNSLSSIGHLSKMGRKDETYKLILAVSKFYRLTLNKGNLYIPLGEELRRITTYLEIQKIKYRERLIIHTDFDEKINDVLIPDFILQPFLENCFAHGWADRPLTIKLSTREENGNVVIAMSDDGIGMKSDQVEDLLQRESPTGGFGIYYVRKRLEYFYQGKAHMNLKSEPDKGTAMNISLPPEGGSVSEQKEQSEYYDMYSILADQKE